MEPTQISWKTNILMKLNFWKKVLPKMLHFQCEKNGDQIPLHILTKLFIFRYTNQKRLLFIENFMVKIMKFSLKDYYHFTFFTD